MEGRPARQARLAWCPRRGLSLLVGIAVVALPVTVWLTMGRADPEVAPAPMTTPDPVPPAEPAFAPADAARIVDDEPRAPASDMRPPSPLAGDGAVSPDPFMQVAARRHEPAHGPKPRLALPGRADTRPAPPRDADLLSTLLDNIEHTRSTEVARAEALDELVRELREEDAATGARLRSQQIQSNLGDCPPANTPAGLACRAEICAVYAGRDPACPAAQ